jgi:hypothetical protein
MKWQEHVDAKGHVITMLFGRPEWENEDSLVETLLELWPCQMVHSPEITTAHQHSFRLGMNECRIWCLTP